MNKLKYLILDFNGTVVDDAKIVGLNSCNHLLKFYSKKEVSLERFQDTFTLPWIKFYIANGVDPAEIDISTHQAEYQRMHTTFAKQAKLVPGFKEDIFYLRSKGIKIALLTTRNKVDLYNELDFYDIKHCFDIIACGTVLHKDGTSSSKDVDKISKAWNILDPSEVLHVGDMDIDVRLAKEHGFVAGVVLGGWNSEKRLRAENPDKVFCSFSEIRTYFD